MYSIMGDTAVYVYGNMEYILKVNGCFPLGRLGRYFVTYVLFGMINMMMKYVDET